MKLVILTVGSTGDVIPMIALGSQLQKEGIEITLATHQIFKEIIEQHGLHFAPIAGDPSQLLKSPLGEALLGNSNSFLQIFHSFKQIQQLLIKEIMRDVWQICQGADGIIYSSLLQAIVPSIAESLKILKIAVLFQPLHPTRLFPCPLLTKQKNLGQYLNLLTWSLLDISQWLPFKNEINQWREKELNLPRISENWRYLSNVRKEEDIVIYAISPKFLKKPEDWSEKIKLPGFFFLENNTHWKPSNELTEFLSKGDKPIYLGFGSVISSQLAPIYEQFIKYVTKNGLRAIIATGWSDYPLKSPSESILIVKEVPHDWLFKRVSVAIHHGGLGTMAATIKAGIPTLVIPFVFDEALWGYTGAKAGIGPQPLLLKKFNENLLNEALSDLIHNTTYVTKSRELSQWVQEERGVESATKNILAQF